MDRFEILRGACNTDGLGLEIGPSYNPVVPKRQGFNVEIVDHLETDALCAKYAAEAIVDADLIEPVDYVTSGGSLTDVIPRRGEYDYIIASHAIEHMPDMLSFLKDCSILLNDRGVLSLAVPDKRFCFDVFRPLSSTGDVLQAFFEKRTRHPPGIAFDHIAYSAHRGGRGGWSGKERARFELENDLERAARFFAMYCETDDYHDLHAWQFTPSSFRLIVHELNEAGHLDLLEHRFHDTIDFEFFLSLSKAGAGCGLDRLELMRRTIQEQGVRILDG